MNDARCVIGDKPHSADVGLLCERHLEQIGVMLREIEEQTILLSAVPSLQQRNGARGGSLASQRAPVRLEVLVHNDPRSRPAGECPVGPACVECWHDTCTDVRSWWDAYDAQATEILSVLDVLGSWARAVRDDDERRLSWPAHVTVTTERDLLSRQLPWIAEQPWVDEFDGDLRKLLGQLRRQNGTNALRKKPVGVCPTLFADGECGGRLWANDQRGEVTCDLCGRLFEPTELRHLGMMLIRQGYVEVFRAEWFTGVPAGTIRRWVSEGRCTSRKDGKKLLVQIVEVEQLRDRRKRHAGVAS